MRPEVVTKGTDGKYHALDLTQKVYVSPSTQAQIHSVDIEAYVSPNGINWSFVPGSATNKAGDGPRLMTSDGVAVFGDTNPGKIWISFRSEDYGVNWASYADGKSSATNQVAPEGLLTNREFELSSGKFLSVQFELNGQMFLRSCTTSSGTCTEIEVQPSFNTTSMYQFDDRTTTITAKDELVFNTLEGIYISSGMR